MEKLVCHKQAPSTSGQQRGPARRTPVVLVSCGSFNPPTVMHMRMFDVAAHKLKQLGYDVLGCYISPVSDAYGKPGLAPARERLAMCDIAAATSPHVMVDRWEASRGGYTRTLQVLRHVQEELARSLQAAAGQQQQAPGGQQQQQQVEVPRVTLLCGADVLESMTRPGVWVQPDVLLREHGAVVVVREGTDMDALLSGSSSTRQGSTGSSGTAQQEEQAGQKQWGEQEAGEVVNVVAAHRDQVVVVVDDVGPGSISSTKVRSEVAGGRPIRYLVPPGVERYIQVRRLYRQEQVAQQGPV